MTYAETTQINKLRKVIKRNNEMLSKANAHAAAANAVNKMFGYTNRPLVTVNSNIEQQNKMIMAEIERLDNIRKAKLKMLRESRKNRQ